MIATLLCEPFGIPLSEIAKLTDRQITRLYYHPRDKEGRIDWSLRRIGEAGTMDRAAEDDAMWSLAEALGMPAEKIQALQAKAREKKT